MKPKSVLAPCVTCKQKDANSQTRAAPQLLSLFEPNEKQRPVKRYTKIIPDQERQRDCTYEGSREEELEK
jgi:hypothetical protein